MDRVHQDDVRALVEELLRTGVGLADLLSRLLDDLPEDAFPGKDNGEVLLEMVSGTVLPVANAAGPATTQRTTALLGAVSDRVMDDLRAALDRSSNS